jgi:uncharacterized SAM-binding protein YcdF (DUF218 family)
MRLILKFFIFVLFFMWMVFIAIVWRSISSNRLPSNAKFNDMIDLVIVPGGGVREGGKLPLWVEARLNASLLISKRRYLACLSFGASNKHPPIDNFGFPVREARAAANYLIANGVKREEILIEEVSLDTIGNAFFTRVIHADPLGLRRLHVITNKFHAARTEYIFRRVFGIDKARGTVLTFQSVDDVGLDAETLQHRLEREQKSLLSLKSSVFASLNSLRALHHFIFTNHSAYAVGGDAHREKLPQKVLDSY